MMPLITHITISILTGIYNVACHLGVNLNTIEVCLQVIPIIPSDLLACYKYWWEMPSILLNDPLLTSVALSAMYRSLPVDTFLFQEYTQTFHGKEDLDPCMENFFHPLQWGIPLSTIKMWMSVLCFPPMCVCCFMMINSWTFFFLNAESEC